jgi:DNA-binding NarL/FixJ family response regulator
LSVVGKADSVASARAGLQTCLSDSGVDVVTLELILPDGDGVELIREIRTRPSNPAVLIVSRVDDPERLAAAIDAGASGLIHKSQPPEEIVTAIRALASGRPVLSSAEVRRWLKLAAEVRERRQAAETALARLSRREREVLELIATGQSDKEIAHKLAVGHETVRSHVGQVLRKLGVGSRLEAVVFAIKYGAITLD